MGAFRGYHLVRNRRALTVVMFHRVLPRADARFAYCDREYTIEADLFGQCLDFFQKHYHVIGVEQLLDGPWAKLPDHPLLITFDDGWADHEQVALPMLAKRGLPALAFIAADAVDNPEPTPFWETRLIHAFHRGALSSDALAAVWRAAGPGEPPSFTSLKDLDALIARLFSLSPQDIPALLAPLDSALCSPDRHLLTHAELVSLPPRGMAIGAHGATHQPLTRAADAGADLRRAQADLAKRTGQPVRTMSCPHGSYNRQSVTAARGAGYELVFTSDRVLNPIPRDGQAPMVLGRLGLDEQQMSDATGVFRPDMLAHWMWRSPIIRLDGERPLRAIHA